MKNYFLIGLMTLCLTGFDWDDPIQVDFSSDTTMEVDLPVTWTLVVKKGDEVVDDFELAHEKYMHMLIVSNDLSRFAHVHPELDKSNGEFTITLNESTDEFDNIQSANALVVSGRHKVYAEVKPTGGEIETAKFDVFVKGEDDKEELIPDTSDEEGVVTKFFCYNGVLDEGDFYRVDFRVKSVNHDGKDMVHFIFHVFQKSDNGSDRYHQVAQSELINWLGMKGHAIVISEGHKNFAHLHIGSHAGHHGGNPAQQSPMDMEDPEMEQPGMDHMGKNDLVFMAMPNQLAEKGLMKIWAQFRLPIENGESLLLTMPVVFDADSFLYEGY